MRNNRPRRLTPLVAAASILSTASLAWTTWSLTDLLGVGAIGVTVAATADLIWASVIWCEYKSIGKTWAIKSIGWLAVVVVGLFIAWHGVTQDNQAMTIAGPFLTVGTKAVWEFALLSIKDPTDLSREQRAHLDKQLQSIQYEMQMAEVATEREVTRRKSESAKKIADINANSDIRIAEMRARQKELAAQRKLDEEMSDAGYRLVRVDQTIPGEIVQQPEAPALAPFVPQEPVGRTHAANQEMTQDKKDMIHVPIDELTESQANLRKTAILWYEAEDDANAAGRTLTKAQFAKDNGLKPVQVSRATMQWPRHEVGLDPDEAQSA